MAPSQYNSGVGWVVMGMHQAHPCKVVPTSYKPKHSGRHYTALAATPLCDFVPGLPGCGFCTDTPPGPRVWVGDDKGFYYGAPCNDSRSSTALGACHEWQATGRRRASTCNDGRCYAEVRARDAFLPLTHLQCLDKTGGVALAKGRRGGSVTPAEQQQNYRQRNVRFSPSLWQVVLSPGTNVW